MYIFCLVHEWVFKPKLLFFRTVKSFLWCGQVCEENLLTYLTHEQNLLVTEPPSNIKLTILKSYSKY